MSRLVLVCLSVVQAAVQKDGASYGYAEKADLCKGYWKRNGQLGVTTHFPEIIN